MLEKEFKYYLANQEKFVKEYNGKHIVIVGEQLVGVYDTLADAYTESQKKHQLGTFLIQLVTPGKSAYTQTFHSRAVFN